MIQLEYMPVVIEAHRNDLRALMHPLPREVAGPSLRRSIGQRLVRAGRWLEGARPSIIGDAPATMGKAPGSA